MHPEVYYLQSAHTCTHITSRITKLCSKPATVHTFSISTVNSTDGFVVVHLAVSTISGSCRAIGFVFPQKSHVRKRMNKKKSHRSREVLKVSMLTQGMLEESNGHKKSKFHHPSHATIPFPLISVSCPKGAITLYYTYPHFMTPLLSTSLPLSPC